MNTLNLGSDEIPEKKKKSNTRNLKIALGLAAVILVPTIGSTLAGTINVSANSIEFGQGFATTLSCQPIGEAITITPVSALDPTSPQFLLDSINVSDISSDCDTKVFRIKLIDETGLVIVLDSGATPTNACLVDYDIGSVTATGACTVESAAGEFTIYYSIVSVLAANVYAITIESENPPIV